jgi:hypothetical protein
MKKRSFNNPYVPGDFVPELGRVDTNHCGLPWVCGMEGLFHGCICIVNKKGLYDALDGKLLSNEEVEERKDNIKFDYGMRAQGKKRPKRELNAISHSINDRYSFAAGKSVSVFNRISWFCWAFIDKIIVCYKEFFNIELESK